MIFRTLKLRRELKNFIESYLKKLMILQRVQILKKIIV